MQYWARSPTFATIVVASLLLQLCFLRSATAASDPPNSTAARHKLFLWRVTGGKGAIYLLGSIHVGRADLYPLPTEIEQLFDTSDYLVEETDFSKADPVQLRRAWIRSALYPSGDRLENHVSDKTIVALADYMRSIGRSDIPVSLAKPWFWAMLIRGWELPAYGVSGQRGIDRHFMDEARALHKPIIPLEPVGLHIDLPSSMYSSLSDDAQEKMLLEAINKAQDYARHIDPLFEAWKNGDAEKMKKLTDAELHDAQLQSFQDQLIYQRNTDMAQQLETYMATEKKYFVVVGAGHLVGDRSILTLLQAKRYQIDQLVVRARAN
jgi:hypothetical protein